jgi:hypothetical protein
MIYYILFISVQVFIAKCLELYCIDQPNIIILSSYISLFYHYCDKIHDRNNLREEGIILLPFSEDSWLLGPMHLGATSWPWEPVVGILHLIVGRKSRKEGTENKAQSSQLCTQGPTFSIRSNS